MGATLNLGTRGIAVTRDGNEVWLSRKQFWSIVTACITPACVVSGFLWQLNNRVTTLEVMRQPMADDINTAEVHIQELRASASALGRIEQRVIDIDRRLERMEDRKP